MAADELGFETEDPEDDATCGREGCGHLFEDHDEDTGICMVDVCECDGFVEEKE